jgi:uncharacterized protein (TIGR03083 family)
VSDQTRAGTGSPDYLGHLGRESARFREALVEAPPGTRVATCPDWDVDDLLWHLAEVQWFWGEVVRSGAGDPDAVEDRKPGRPSDRHSLVDFFDRASHDLADLLARTAPRTRVWTWSRDQSVGFVRRRQAHEALVHRLDAELAVDARTPMDAALCADGIDEILRLMLGQVPAWGGFTADPGNVLRVRTSDTGHAWLVTVGRFTGTSPNTGRTYDEPVLDVAAADDGRPVEATLSGAAADLDCLLWNRPAVGPVERSGDAAALAAFDAVVALGVQ